MQTRFQTRKIKIEVLSSLRLNKLSREIWIEKIQPLFMLLKTAKNRCYLPFWHFFPSRNSMNETETNFWEYSSRSKQLLDETSMKESNPIIFEKFEYEYQEVSKLIALFGASVVAPFQYNEQKWWKCYRIFSSIKKLSSGTLIKEIRRVNFGKKSVWNPKRIVYRYFIES